MANSTGLFEKRSTPLPFGISDPSKVTDLSKSQFNAALAVERQEKAEKRAQYTLAGRVTMPFTEWAQIPENPIQRNTVRRAATATHLHTYDPVHQIVSVGRYPDGRLVKIDAHTRCHLWCTGKVAGPKDVLVDIFDLASNEAAIDLYERFDGKRAAEKGQDTVYGAMRLYKLDPQSSFVKAGRFSTALKKLYRSRYENGRAWLDGELTRQAVNHYRDQLQFLDSLDASPETFKVGVVMALLASHKLHGGQNSVTRSRMIEFWTRFAQDKGEKANGFVDPVQALFEEVKDATEISKKKGHGGNLQEHLYGKSLLALQKYLRRENFKAGKYGGIRGSDQNLVKIYTRGPVEKKVA